MDLQLSGEVTGGTKGIGRAIVESLVAEGARVGFCARIAADAETAENELGAVGGEVAGTALDVTDGAAPADRVTASADRFGGLDAVVPEVSALADGPSEDDWAAGFQTDPMHTVRLCEAALPQLARSRASVVAVSSVSGREIDFAKGEVTMLASPRASFITGTNLVDGALTRGVQL